MINAISLYFQTHLGLKYSTTQPYGLYKNADGKVFAIFKIKDKQDFNSSLLAPIMFDNITEIDNESYLHINIMHESDVTKQLEAGELKLIETK